MQNKEKAPEPDEKKEPAKAMMILICWIDKGCEILVRLRGVFIFLFILLLIFIILSVSGPAHYEQPPQWLKPEPLAEQSDARAELASSNASSASRFPNTPPE